MPRRAACRQCRRRPTSASRPFFSLSDDKLGLAPTKIRPPRFHLPEEEIALGPACYLFDYLRRSGAAGFLLPLSGGIDSCATATIIFSMCRLAMAAVDAGEQLVIDVVKRWCRHAEAFPKTPQELCNNIMHVRGPPLFLCGIR